MLLSRAFLENATVLHALDRLAEQEAQVQLAPAVDNHADNVSDAGQADTADVSMGDVDHPIDVDDEGVHTGATKRRRSMRLQQQKEQPEQTEAAHSPAGGPQRRKEGKGKADEAEGHDFGNVVAAASGGCGCGCGRGGSRQVGIHTLDPSPEPPLARATPIVGMAATDVSPACRPAPSARVARPANCPGSSARFARPNRGIQARPAQQKRGNRARPVPTTLRAPREHREPLAPASIARAGRLRCVIM